MMGPSSSRTVAVPAPRSSSSPAKMLDAPMKSATNSVSGASYISPRRAELDDAAGVHDRDPVRHRHRLFLIVRDVDEGDADLAVDADQFELHLLAHLQVESPSGSSSRRTRGRLTSARARATRCCCPPDSSLGRRLPSRRGPPTRATAATRRRFSPCRARHPRAEADILAHRHVRKQRIALKDRVHGAAIRRQLQHRPVLDQHVAATRFEKPADHAEQGGLCRTRSVPAARRTRPCGSRARCRTARGRPDTGRRRRAARSRLGPRARPSRRPADPAAPARRSRPAPL